MLDHAGGAATWRALGTYVELRVRTGQLAEAVDIAREVLADVDASYSRFRPDSELSRANERVGTPTAISPLFEGALSVALEAAVETDGLVDPTVGPALLRGGYDRHFALVPADDPTPVALPSARPDWRAVRLGSGTVTVPEGGCLDLGATGKAFAADLLALTLEERFGGPVLVGLGGDLRVVAAGPMPGGFPVSLGHTQAQAAGPDPLAQVRLTDGGLATSSTAARRWNRAGRPWHHVVDPRTGEPATGLWRTCTALGRTAVAANVASTTAIILGEAAEGWLRARGVAARLVDMDGFTVRTPAWLAADVELVA